MSFLSNNNTSKFSFLDYKVVNNIKTLALDMINEASSGHYGIVLDAAPIIYDLYARHMTIDVTNPKFVNRDRFVMSCGHGSALLYSTLYFSGFDLKLDDLKNFRKIDSLTPGHPDYNITPGVDCTTGLLGEGFANAVGMAIGERYLNNRYSSGKNSLIDHYTYVLCSDGDLMEGVSYEAASIAGNLKLGKLIVLYDSNNMTYDGPTKETFKENVLDRFKALNWDTYLVNDGNNLDLIDDAINRAKSVLDKPSIIEVKTVIGYGSKYENNYLAHGCNLDEKDISKIKDKLDIRDVPFTVLDDAYNYMKEQISLRNNKAIGDYNKSIESILPKLKSSYREEFNNYLDNKNIIEFDTTNLDLKKKTSLREVSSIILGEMFDKNGLLLKGSSDLAFSTKTYVESVKDFTSFNYGGRNLLFGVREHAMGSIASGIALSNIRPIVSTHLVFSDFLKPSIRMASLMNLPVTYIFTHDSIYNSMDGPTHEAIEQLIALRSIPNLTVYKPSDTNELLGSYKNIINNNNPSALIISSEDITPSKHTKINGVEKGGYIALDYEKINGILIATGYELNLALKISEELALKKIYLRVVSIPSLELFKEQSKEYREKVLPEMTKKAVIEFSSSYSWYEYVYNDKYLFTIDSFGYSGSKRDVLDKFNLSCEKLFNQIEDLFK